MAASTVVGHVNARRGQTRDTVDTGLHPPEIYPATSIDRNLPSKVLESKLDIGKVAYTDRGYRAV
jgi:hypothetical protein